MGHGFEGFFLGSRRRLLGVALRLGASWDEADDAVAAAMKDVLVRWDDIENPFAYARTAVRSHLVRERSRGLDTRRRRLAERGAGVPEAAEDDALTRHEDAD